MTAFHTMSATELIAGYRDKSFSPVEVTEAILQRIDQLDPKVNAFVTKTPELAIEQARAAEAAYRSGLFCFAEPRSSSSFFSRSCIAPA